MTRVATDKGFVLPIVMLIAAGMGLLWSSIPFSQSAFQEFAENSRIQAEILFWHRAMVAYAFREGGGGYSLNEVVSAYDLELPQLQFTAASDVISFEADFTYTSGVTMRVCGLPEALLDEYIRLYPSTMESTAYGCLRARIKAIDDWQATQTVVTRRHTSEADMNGDLSLHGRDIDSLHTNSGNLYASVADLQTTSTVIDATVSVLDAKAIETTSAVIDGRDLDALLNQFVTLEAQMSACLAATGPC